MNYPHGASVLTKKQTKNRAWLSNAPLLRFRVYKINCGNWLSDVGFQPVLVKKRQMRLESFKEKILALYAHGMTLL